MQLPHQGEQYSSEACHHYKCMENNRQESRGAGHEHKVHSRLRDRETGVGEGGYVRAVVVVKFVNVMSP
jgi:hypothetical protein